MGYGGVGRIARLIFFDSLARMKSKILLLVLLHLGVLAALYFIHCTRRPAIHDVWIVNLDRDTKRLAHVQEQALAIPAPKNRWPATYGKSEDRRAARRDGVCMFLMVSDDEAENKRTTTILQKPGVIGCWLSHKRLLRHLGSVSASSSAGHLILEDDVDISADFADRWASVRSHVPADWDVVYFGVGKPTGVPVAPGVLRAIKKEESGNTGTYAYLVRHGAIPAILKKLDFMSSPIDKQYYKMFTDLKVYILEPPLVAPGTFESSILTMEQRSV